MGMSLNSGAGGGRRGRRRARKAPMSEINVTPMVDVMLVLLIIFMVAAPLLTSGVPIELPSSATKPLPTPKTEPLTLSIKANGDVFVADAPVPLNELVAKLKAISEARKGEDEPIFVRGDKGVNYGSVMKVMGRISAGGFKKVSLVTEVEDGG